MRKDPHAKAAYQALRRRGVSPKKAEALIERVSREAFISVLCHGANWRDADPRPECWLLLAEGLPVESQSEMLVPGWLDETFAVHETLSW